MDIYIYSFFCITFFFWVQVFAYQMIGYCNTLSYNISRLFAKAIARIVINSYSKGRTPPPGKYPLYIK